MCQLPYPWIGHNSSDLLFIFGKRYESSRASGCSSINASGRSRYRLCFWCLFFDPLCSISPHLSQLQGWLLAYSRLYLLYLSRLLSIILYSMSHFIWPTERSVHPLVWALAWVGGYLRSFNELFNLVHAPRVVIYNLKHFDLRFPAAHYSVLALHSYGVP